MPQRKRTTNQEQLDLIDMDPENAKPLKRAVRAYRKAQAERIAWLADEKKHKQKIIALTREAKIRPNADGVIYFRLDGMVIKITPRDELVQVKIGEEVEEPEGDED